jgi:biopolymer transport protein TolR
MTMRNKRRRSKHLMADINVVPYIDVMLVLLVIFMITTPLMTQGVEIDLPKAQAKALSSENEEPIVISVNKEGQYFLNVAENPNKPMTSRALVNMVAAYLKLAQEGHVTRQVMIRGDKEVGYGKVVSAMALLQQAGVENVGLITQTPQVVSE